MRKPHKEQQILTTYMPNVIKICFKTICYINKISQLYPKCDILLAYGNLITKRKYLKECLNEILQILSIKDRKTIKIIKLTKAGNPIHTLYQSNTADLTDYEI